MMFLLLISELSPTSPFPVLHHCFLPFLTLPHLPPPLIQSLGSASVSVENLLNVPGSGSLGIPWQGWGL